MWSVAKELCYLRSTWFLLFLLCFSVRALWRKSAAAWMGQSNEQHTWRKRGTDVPGSAIWVWLSIILHLEEIPISFTPPQISCIYGADIAVLPKRPWAEDCPARALRCSNIPHFPGTSMNNYRRCIKEPSMVSLAPRISVLGASVGKIFSQSQ